jgi:thiol-disulfide isomerase/thioredoxin
MVKKNFLLGLFSAVIILGAGKLLFPQIASQPKAQIEEGLQLHDINFVPNLPPSTLFESDITYYIFEKDKFEKKTAKLTDFEGKPMMIHFWTTWCGPCKRELPHFVKFVDDEKITYLAVTNEDLAPEKVHEFLKECKIEHLVVVIDSSNHFGRHLNMGALPTTVFIDNKRRDKGRVVGPIDWLKPDVVALIKKELF